MTEDLHHELVQQVRGMLLRGVVGAVDDTGDVQTVDLATGDDVQRSLVEVHQPYGFFSNPPAANPGDTMTLVFSVGGDQGHQVALQLWSQGYRFGRAAPGESGIYHWGGSRLHHKNGGNTDLLVAVLLTIAAQTLNMTSTQAMTIGAGQGLTVTAGTTMTLSAPGGFTFTGPVEFKSPVTFDQGVTITGGATITGNAAITGNLTVTGGTITGTGASGRAL